MIFCKHSLAVAQNLHGQSRGPSLYQLCARPAGLAKQTSQTREILPPRMAADLAGEITNRAVDDDIGPQVLQFVARGDAVNGPENDARVWDFRVKSVLERAQFFRIANDGKALDKIGLSKRRFGRLKVVGADKEAGPQVLVLEVVPVHHPELPAKGQGTEEIQDAVADRASPDQEGLEVKPLRYRGAGIFPTALIRPTAERQP